MLASVLVVGTLLSACGASDYHYVKNSSEGAFVRLPSDWEIYDEDEYLRGFGEPGLDVSTSQLEQLRRGWTVAFDSAPDPKELLLVEGGHFGLIYHPSPLFDQASAAQADFLARHLA